jgi:hypothetical protein
VDSVLVKAFVVVDRQGSGLITHSLSSCLPQNVGQHTLLCHGHDHCEIHNIDSKTSGWQELTFLVAKLTPGLLRFPCESEPY